VSIEPARDQIREIVERALAEDVGAGDVTSQAVVPESASAAASIVQKQAGVLFGFEAAAEAFRQAGAEAFDTMVVEGQWRETVPRTVVRAFGRARALLAAERTALNLLGHLSGIATLTARYVQAVEGTGVRILDTRKTTPGLRELEKEAVVAGGGANHRMGLYDAFLIKENHAAIAGGVGEAVTLARGSGRGLPVEVECRDVAEIRAAVDAGAQRLLLDNMDPDVLRVAVAAATSGPFAPELEASGGITLENVADYAATGVEFISVGALTHSAPNLDLSLDLQPGG
jgi:nicotinate-nucleotide pyrophosphorylase (carboxylating)